MRPHFCNSKLIARLVLGPLTLLLYVGCGREKPVESASPELGREQTEATERMANDLKRLYQETLENPLAYYYLNQEHAVRIRREMSSHGDPAPFQMRLAYASALLNGGETEAAIEQIESMFRESGGSDAPISRGGRELQDMLGIAYLRLGEQQNCISNPTAASCILPIRDEAVHRLPNGSLRAIEIYTRLLDRYRADYGSRWLLNVAYMTLGKYPDEVPVDVLIPGLEADTAAAVSRFENVAGELGVDIDDLAGGVAVEDFNKDGFLDIFATAHRLNDRCRLFLNDGQGGFKDVSEGAGLTGISGGLNILHADYNNDGYDDVLILRGAWLGGAGNHPNSLLRNNGDGTFQDATEEAGLLSYHPTHSAAWSDFNNDGWLDLFVGNEDADRWLRAWQSASSSHGADNKSHPSQLYLNNGDGTFTEVATKFGIDLQAFVKGAAWGDVNNDGLPDLYVSIMGSPNRLYMNRGAQEPDGWLFEEVAAGVHEPFFSFPTWFFDYDNDGWEDLFVAPYDLRRINDAAADVAREYVGGPVETELPRLFRNNRDGTFTDVTVEAGLNKVLFAMGSNFGDLDNDGYLDFYVGTGAPDLQAVIPNRMFRNLDGSRFEEVTFEGGFGHIQKGHAVAFADFDHDGDQDIYASIGGAYGGDGYANVLFENPGSKEGHAWITLRLEGRKSNHSAIGARIKVTVSDREGVRRNIYRTVTTGGSFGSSSLQQEIGLGRATRIDEVEVIWPNPSRTIERFSGLEVNRYYRIIEGRPQADVVAARNTPFRRERGGPHQHAEAP